RARVPPSRRDPALRAATPAGRLDRPLPADEDRPPHVVAPEAEVTPLVPLRARADLLCFRIVRVRGQPARDRPPVERLVPVPVVLRGRDHRNDREPSVSNTVTVPSSVVKSSFRSS